MMIEISDLFTVHALASFLTLAALEVVLGIDNLVFISILSDKLPPEQQSRARRLGLGLALIFRLLLLFTITWIAQLIQPLFTVFDFPISGRDLILLGGGIFLLAKATLEIHEKIEHNGISGAPKKTGIFYKVLIQIVLIDIVFSFDSIITAVGLSGNLVIMVAAILVSMIVMITAINTVSRFINNHPTIKMLALSFLLLIGMALVAEGLHFEIPKGYIYFAMLFSLFVEGLNIVSRPDSKKK